MHLYLRQENVLNYLLQNSFVLMVFKTNMKRQAGAELGQAQQKLGLKIKLNCEGVV